MRNSMKTLFTLGMLGLMGCNTIPQPSVPVADRTNVVRRALCMGLTNVDPVKYSGWVGECPGADVDAKQCHARFQLDKFDKVVLLLNEQATDSRFEKETLELAKDLKPWDLLAITLSGHGGQGPDLNGDELDGLDETLCLWNGEYIDDRFMTLLERLPPCRVFLITDTCHSQGNFRSWGKRAVQTITLGTLGMPTTGEDIVDDGRKQAWEGQVLQFAGCRESASSFGSEDGGQWTKALWYVPSLTNLSYSTWFLKAKENMPSYQEPTKATHNLDAGYEDSRSLR